MDPTDRVRSPGRGPWIAALAPLALGAGLCTLLRTEPSSPAAPVLGPWAGLLYGHGDCTVATAAPVFAWSAVGLVVTAAAALALAPAGAYWARALLAASASLVWSAAALASVLNTLS